jgi:predicted nucleic acid-binding protein
MKVAYVDTSWLVAIAFGEPEGRASAELLPGYDVLLSAALLEAEFLAALHREGQQGHAARETGITLVHPDRSLRTEIETALDAGYLRGADLWHVATALYVSPVPAETDFLTFDERQRDVARALGFRIPG